MHGRLPSTIVSLAQFQGFPHRYAQPYHRHHPLLVTRGAYKRACAHRSSQRVDDDTFECLGYGGPPAPAASALWIFHYHYVRTAQAGDSDWPTYTPSYTSAFLTPRTPPPVPALLFARFPFADRPPPLTLESLNPHALGVVVDARCTFTDRPPPLTLESLNPHALGVVVDARCTFTDMPPPLTLESLKPHALGVVVDALVASHARPTLVIEEWPADGGALQLPNVSSETPKKPSEKTRAGIAEANAQAWQRVPSSCPGRSPS
ncbi:hypothetical protein FKP32DRAFT_1678118 [Trametes sanguinea]|nr:hypothetical protein FKP32DRAFT_1678118 [Trametes sanguinea]